jgi:transcriptional regulator with XRE-family HTH domain
MATTAERLQQALEIRNIKQIELAELSGISRSSINEYLKGKCEPKQRAIFKMANILGVSEPWLMGLDVPMERIYNKNEVLNFNEIHTLIARNGKNMTTEEKQEIIKTLLSDD